MEDSIKTIGEDFIKKLKNIDHKKRKTSIMNKRSIYNDQIQPISQKSTKNKDYQSKNSDETEFHSSKLSQSEKKNQKNKQNNKKQKIVFSKSKSLFQKPKRGIVLTRRQKAEIKLQNEIIRQENLNENNRSEDVFKDRKQDELKTWIRKHQKLSLIHI